ncbi:ComEA family DNA-binding protein [candidate division WOR-3 bacterium]|nr:ComEA family DNA-binding protein [candidate division WOR-3 bacterium]
MDSVVARASVEMAPAPAGPRDACAGQVVAEAVRAAVGSHISLVPTSAIESGLAGPALARRELHDCVPHRERLLLAVLDDTSLHKLLAGLPADEPLPYLAGADLFMLGDTTIWPLVSQVCRVRYRDGRSIHRVVAPQQLYRAAGIESSGNPVASNLTELWLEFAESLDTIRPAGWLKMFSPTAGLLPVPASDSGPVNINTAGMEELQRLPGVGPATARRILVWREARGPFGSVDELANVSGIGPAKLEKIRPLATVRD